MASFKNIVLVVLVAVLAVSFVEQASTASIDLENVARRSANWTTCDITSDPTLSCEDCNTRLICNPIGGLLISCLSPFRPYCVNGICSPIPSAECQ